ncbi:dipeptidase [Halopolyspora algeriensis]|uniref:Dipeptidase n=1 Tax=Halopolyspora algeriensis TaxID=1500506 RepID=A0A368VL70_9ACTN|nr:C69 family dipeptidase [Halopolyspora algeriensis]RCW39741.1 dipeptidase [Halopolyspora algeriensis]TQM56396.1 dipeptidase [Halopolyspora algeriensis]
MHRRVFSYPATFVTAVLVTVAGMHLAPGNPHDVSEKALGSTSEKAADHRRASPAGDRKESRKERADQKSYGIYVGRNLTADGSVMLGGTGDEVSSHWLEIVPAEDHPEDATITVGVTDEATIPGSLTEIPQVSHTYKYISMNYSEWAGFPPPLTNGGMNEHQVAIRDIWSPSRQELVEMAPTPQEGPQYSDLARIGLQRAKTARQAVEIIGNTIDEYGYSTYGGNSHFIADPQEAWVVIELAGGQGLWVAERLGPNEVRMSYPGYIQEIPRNCREHPDYMCSENFIDFAVEQGWWNPDSGEPFNVNEVYGEQGWNYRTTPAEGKFVAPATIEQELESKAPVTLEEFMETVRDPRISSDQNGYGQVAHLRDGIDRALGQLWVSPTGSVTSPFIPYHIGVQDEPAEYRQHRYLTKNAAETYINPAYAPQEATTFAGRLFKRLMYHTCTRPKEFYPEVHTALTAFEDDMRREQPEVEKTARTLIEAGQRKLAQRYLTEYSHTQAAEAMDLGESLVSSIEARVKLRYGIPEPPNSENINGGGFEEGNFVTCYRQDNSKLPNGR